MGIPHATWLYNCTTAKSVVLWKVSGEKSKENNISDQHRSEKGNKVTVKTVSRKGNRRCKVTVSGSRADAVCEINHLLARIERPTSEK